MILAIIGILTAIYAPFICLMAFVCCIERGDTE